MLQYPSPSLSNSTAWHTGHQIVKKAYVQLVVPSTSCMHNSTVAREKILAHTMINEYTFTRGINKNNPQNWGRGRARNQPTIARRWNKKKGAPDDGRFPLDFFPPRCSGRRFFQCICTYVTCFLLYKLICNVVYDVLTRLRNLEPDGGFVLQIFMHKSMQMQLQQRGGGAASVGSSSFSSSGGLEISKPHQCQQCLKSFSSNHQLVQHIRVHTGEKPYKCSYCERRFKQLSHVQQHTRLHTGKKD